METHKDDWFLRRTNELLVTSLSQPFATSIEAIDELEQEAISRLESGLALEARKSCADLRLDAAINSHQDFGTCANLYNTLTGLGVGPTIELTKAVMIARECAESDRRALKLLSSALAHAKSGNIPPTLMVAAKTVLADFGEL